MREDGEMASQSSMLEHTGVRGQVLIILCMPESIARNSFVLWILQQGKKETTYRTYQSFPGTSCRLAKVVLKYQ